MKNYFLIFTIIVICSSCSLFFKILRKNVDSEGKTNVKSKYNQDNVIFKNNSSITYNVQQKLKEKIIDFDLTLIVIPGKMNGGTKIKYKYYYTSNNLTESEKSKYLDTIKFFKGEITNVIEDSTKLFIHPPRSYSLEKMELSPFPIVKFPAKKGLKWASKMFIGAGWGELAGKTIEFNYSINNVNFFDNYYTANISALSSFDSDKKYCIATFDFHSSKGFTKLNYVFSDSTEITFTIK